MAQSTVFRLEAGDFHIQFDTLLKVLAELALSPDELLSKKPASRALSAADERLLEYLADPNVKEVVAKLSTLIQPIKSGTR